jgi:hypothetical protein
MLFSTVVSYAAGLGFLYAARPAARWVCLVIPILVDLSLLGFFKYAAFVAASLQSALDWAGAGVQVPDAFWFGPGESYRFRDIVLPVGISFYTFHTISYIVDCYRGVVRPTRNVFEFAAYVSLFSQLVAGPIVRFRQIEADLEVMVHTPRSDLVRAGGYGDVGDMTRTAGRGIPPELAAQMMPAVRAFDLALFTEIDQLRAEVRDLKGRLADGHPPHENSSLPPSTVTLCQQRFQVGPLSRLGPGQCRVVQAAFFRHKFPQHLVKGM